MRCHIWTLALALLLVLLDSRLAHAHPPNYSDEPPAVDEHDAGTATGAGYALPPLKYKQPQEPQEAQPQQHEQPPSNTQPGTAAYETPMQPAFAYDAAVPVHVDKVAAAAASSSYHHDEDNAEREGESSKKIIGSSVVTSVSVVLNGNEPEFTDAIGHRVPKPQPSLQVASPIDLLNPDRYEFYTFDDNGELVKRLMTMQEIQSIVANGDGEGPSIIHTGPIDERDPERNVQDIVDSVQNVLNKEVESSKNTSAETLPVLDTPDVSSTWSLILPAIFGNSGGDIFPQQRPQQIVMTPDSELLETSTKATPPRSTKKPKPAKRKPGQKRKTTTSTTTTEMPPQVVQEELDPMESVYTGMHQYQNIASNMQSFEGFSQMHMQPIYHKLPEATNAAAAAQPETGTKHIFVNNLEMIQTNSDAKPSNATENVELTEHLAKKPIGVHQKPMHHTPPHRVKKPNDSASSTKRPQGTPTKQKIKKKPTTTLAPTIPTEPTTITTTSTTAHIPTVATTPKKKKQKPSRKPGNHTGGHGSSTSTKPHPSGEKRKPQRPAAHHRPKPTHAATPAPTTIPTPPPTLVPKPTAAPVKDHQKHHGTHDLTAAPSAHQESTHKQQIGHHKQRPRPHRPHHSSSSSTTSTSIAPALIVQPFPGYVPLQTPTTTSAAPGLIVQEYPGLPAQFTTTTTTTRPTYAANTSGYPVPAYGMQTAEPQHSVESQELDYSQLKRKPLPSLAMIQQQHHKPTHPPQPDEDMSAIMSFDQLMQSLKEGEKLETPNANAEPNSETEASSKQPPAPVKYEGAEPVNQTEKIVEHKQQTVAGSAPVPTATPSSSTTSTTAVITTTRAPILDIVNVASTLAPKFPEEEAMTGRPYDEYKTTDASSTEETTISEEENTPVVIITQRPLFFANTRKPTMPETTTNSPYNSELTAAAAAEQEEESLYSTELPSYTAQNLGTTQGLEAESETKYATPSTTAKPTEASNMEEQSPVVHFTPLYADVQEPLVTELTTTEAPQPTNSYNNEQDESTIAELAEDFDTQTETNFETAQTESTYTTQSLQRLPVNRPQIIQSSVKDEAESTEMPPLVADLKPNLNMDIIKPQDQINMSDFQTQAATVASTLVDGTNTLAADVFMSSNETKSELEFLMSDVIQQITNQQKYTPPQQDSNRLTNFAQLNSSFLLKAGQVAAAHQQSSVSNNAYGVATTAAAEFYNPEVALKPDPPYKPVLKQPATVQKVQPTTLIPSKEQLIQKEQEYLSSLKEQAAVNVATAAPHVPNYEEETSTFTIPIPSLSQIYAQQQQEQDQDEDENDAVLEMQKEKSTAAPATEAQSEQDTATAEIATTSKEVPEEMSTEQQYTEELKNDESDSTEAAEAQTHKLHSEALESSTEKQHSQSGYATMINTEQHEHPITPSEADNLHASAAPVTHETQTNATEEESTESGYAIMINASMDKVNPSTEDSITHMAQPAAEYASELPAIETQTQSDEQQPLKETTASIETSASMEESTELPGENTVVLSESDMEISSEQFTERYETVTSVYEDKTEAVEESTEELSAVISEEDESEESMEEDPYIKLGEIGSKPVLQSEEQKPSAEKNEQVQQTAGLTDYAVDEAAKPLKSTAQPAAQLQQDSVVNGHQAMMPAMLSYDQADEEDEEDQNGYEVPSSSTTTTTTPAPTSSSTTTKSSTTTTTTTTTKPATFTTKRVNTLKPVSYFKQPALNDYNQPEPPKVITYTAASTSQRPMQRPPALSNLMATSSQATRPPVKLDPSPEHSKGLEASTANLDEDVRQFARLCNELAFSYWKSITSEKISSARSLVLSPFALTSMLSMVFLGARGGTSGEMNEVLRLDDMVTFNPHLTFKNITDSVEHATDSDIATTAFVREIFSERANGKILPFFKEKVQQLYSGHVEEVNFHVVNDIIRRRTNLLVKRHTMGKVLEYLRTNSVWVNGPLATISANLFQTDCAHGSTHDRDGEMFFQVHPTVRQRRLVPIPAVLYKNGFTAGYEPKMDATVVAFGHIGDTVSTIYVMPGHQSSISPADNLDRLEKELVELAFSQNAWSDLLTSLMDRPDMEVQLPRFSHRSFVNASLGLQKMGLKGLFKSDFADLRGLTGSPNRDIFLSDMIQINTFSTCGEEKISDHHHVEMYPAPPLRKRNKDVDATEDGEPDSSEAIIDFGSLVHDSVLGRGFYDDLLDPKYLELPLPLRPRQARVPDSPRLRFDKPFLYFVRHNPTGMILFMGRFNPRLLP